MGRPLLQFPGRIHPRLLWAWRGVIFFGGGGLAGGGWVEVIGWIGPADSSSLSFVEAIPRTGMGVADDSKRNPENL